MNALLFMVDDKMCCGIVKDQMARIGTDTCEKALTCIIH